MKNEIQKYVYFKQKTYRYLPVFVVINSFYLIQILLISSHLPQEQHLFFSNSQ